METGHLDEMPMKALLIIDMFNRLDFPGAENLAPRALAIAGPLSVASREIAAEGGAVFYVNDDVADGACELLEVKAVMIEQGGISAEIARCLNIGSGSVLLTKPQHSAFYETPLAERLEALGVTEVWIGGVAADLCVLASAIDATMRGFAVRVPKNLVASETREQWSSALELLGRSFKIDITPWVPAADDLGAVAES